MITEKNELIEAYLTNKLPATEAASFEAELAKDPALQKEVTLQKDIITTLQKTRKAELKNRLSNITVATSLSYTQKIGITAIALSSLLLLTYGLYEFNKKELVQEVPKLEQSNNNEVIYPKPTAIAVTEEVVNTIAAPEVEKTVSEVVVEKPKTRKATPVATNVPEDLAIPTPIEFEFEGSGVKHDVLNSPKDAYSDNENNKIHTITPEIDNNDKKVHQYKYDGERLILIGDFSSTNPYYLIESPKNSTTELYLKFNETFYAIKETKKAAALEQVTDKRILHELSKK